MASLSRALEEVLVAWDSKTLTKEERCSLVRRLPLPLHAFLCQELATAKRSLYDKILATLKTFQETAKNNLLRSKWILLRQFPSMPPFGTEWFHPISQGSLLGVLREAWIYRNTELDDADRVLFQRETVELQGFYNNPEFYWRVQEHKEGSKTVTQEPFRVIYDTSAFNRKLGLAQAGTPEILPPNLEIAAKVSAFREEQARQCMHDPRVVSAIEDVSDPNAGLLAPQDISSEILEVVKKNKE